MKVFVYFIVLAVLLFSKTITVLVPQNDIEFSQVGDILIDNDISGIQLVPNGVMALDDLMINRAKAALVTSLDIASFCMHHKRYCAEHLSAQKMDSYRVIIAYTNNIEEYRTFRDIYRVDTKILVGKLNSESYSIVKLLKDKLGLPSPMLYTLNNWDRGYVSKSFVPRNADILIEVFNRNKTYSRMEYYKQYGDVPLAINVPYVTVKLADGQVVYAYNKGTINYSHYKGDKRKEKIPTVYIDTYIVHNDGKDVNAYYDLGNRINNILDAFDSVESDVNE